MALMICKNCGKKVSDTVNKCIHCGKNPKEEKKLEEKSEKEKSEKIEKVDFNNYSEDDKKYLEQQFINEDKVAKKYIVSSRELSAFRFPLFLYLALVFVFLRICHAIDENMITNEVVNNTAYVVATVSICALAILVFSMFIYSVVRGIQFKISHSRFVYLKRFQQWLKRKNISYTPKFIKIKDKALFESIQLD